MARRSPAYSTISDLKGELGQRELRWRRKLPRVSTLVCCREEEDETGEGQSGGSRAQS